MRELQRRDDDFTGSCERAACEVGIPYGWRNLEVGSAFCEVGLFAEGFCEGVLQYVGVDFSGGGIGRLVYGERLLVRGLGREDGRDLAGGGEGVDADGEAEEDACCAAEEGEDDADKRAAAGLGWWWWWWWCGELLLLLGGLEVGLLAWGMG